ncbi:MAG: hypothetical protein EOO17_05935 [Chloroflexi bacterium]|nr:MAG: hypothetical protein EOO17_05935 [Chloroflexota bacterium]
MFKLSHTTVTAALTAMSIFALSGCSDTKEAVVSEPPAPTRLVPSTERFDNAIDYSTAGQRPGYRYILCKHDDAIKIDLNDSVGSSNHANGVSITLDGEGKDTTATVGFQQRPSNVAAVIVVFSRGSDADNEILDSSEVSAWNPEMEQGLTIKADDFRIFGLRNVSIELCPSTP